MNEVAGPRKIGIQLREHVIGAEKGNAARRPFCVRHQAVPSAVLELPGVVWPAVQQIHGSIWGEVMNFADDDGEHRVLGRMCQQIGDAIAQCFNPFGGDLIGSALWAIAVAFGADGAYEPAFGESIDGVVKGSGAQFDYAVRGALEQHLVHLVG